MKKRNPLAVFFLGLITFGIYDIYWLVKTKKVLNEKTRYHTPTIWLLILPGLILTAGYAMFFTASILDAVHNSSSSSLTSSKNVAPGEQLNSRGQRRPVQYVHICDTTNGIEYVSQGDPRCLGNDQYKADYVYSVPGTAYSSPCKTTGSPARYVYISSSEQCPPETQLVFYNQIDAGTTYNTNSTSLSVNGSQDTSISQTTHPGLYFGAFGLIAVGFIASFSIGIFWFFRFSKAINEYTRGKMSTAVTFLILWLVHLIGVALIQDTFNEMDDTVPAPNASIAPVTPPMEPPTASSIQQSPIPPLEQHTPEEPYQRTEPPQDTDHHHDDHSKIES